MKTSSWLPIIKSILLCLLVQVLKTTAAAENRFHSKYEGVVDGNVTFYCPVDETQKLQFLYFQKGDVFVNGYYNGKSLESTWPNTRLDLNQTTMHMYKLNLSHTGKYMCHFKYINSTGNPISVSLYLLVTAPFSKPLITQTCEDNGCNVTCASHNGYPEQQITWQMEANSNQTWEIEVLTNPSTKTLNISSTGYINCSSEVKVSCSVGRIISDVISVCAPPPSSSYSFTVIIAALICLSLGLASCLAVSVYKIYKKRRNALSRTVTPDPLEDVPLSGVEAAP